MRPIRTIGATAGRRLQARVEIFDMFTIQRPGARVAP